MAVNPPQPLTFAAMKIPSRLIGTFGGDEPGPLVFAIGGLHGNEAAGIKAIQQVYQLLDLEKKSNPNFTFIGKLVGIAGNLQALALQQRFIIQDLNRMWTPELIEMALAETNPENEYLELRETFILMRDMIAETRPEKVIILDLHTTSADGGIFTIPFPDTESLKLAVELRAPVIQGMFSGLGGTLLQYIAYGNLKVDGFPKMATGVAFEAGQHDDPDSVSRSISAVLNCLRTEGCILSDDMELRMNENQIKFSQNLPKVTDLAYIHHLQPDDEFQMLPGFVNFQPIHEGQILARDRKGAVLAPCDGLILMPLYQKKGTDGFFIVKKIA